MINGSYKSSIETWTWINPVDAAVDLQQPKTLQTVVLVAGSYNFLSADYLGDCEIILVNSSTEVVSKTGVYDTGIYNLDTPVEATRIIIRRVAKSNGFYFAFNHVRAYQSTNLL